MHMYVSMYQNGKSVHFRDELKINNKKTGRNSVITVQSLEAQKKYFIITNIKS